MPAIREDWFEAEQLILASQRGDITEMARLHAAGYDIDLMDELSRAALHYAVENEHHEAVQWLIAHGATVDLRNEDLLGESPLNVAAAGNRQELVELLLRHGANPDLPCWMNTTARIRAQQRTDAEGENIAALIEKCRPAQPNPGARKPHGA